jgi:hypothetical protein
MGIYNRQQLKKLKSTLEKVQTQQQQQLGILRNHDNQLQQIKTELEQLTNVIAFLTFTNPAYLVTSLTKTEFHIRDALDIATHFIQQLQSRRLSIDFLPRDQLENVFNKIRKITDSSNYRLIPEQISDLFQLETSFFTEDSTVTAVLHVPIAPKDSILRLFRFRPFPLPLNSDVTVMPKVESDVLAISHGDRFSMELKYSDLMDCHNVNKVYLCEKHGILSKNLQKSCLGSLWNQNFNSAHKLCQMQLQPYQEVVIQLADNWYLMWIAQAFTIPIKCHNGSESDLHLRSGINKIHLDASCKATLDDHVIFADADHHLDGAIKHFEWHWDTATQNYFQSESIRTSITNIIDDGHSKFLLADVLQDKAIHKRTPGWIVFWITFAVSAAACLAIFCSAVVYWHKFAFIKKFINTQITTIRSTIESFFPSPHEALATEDPSITKK